MSTSFECSVFGEPEKWQKTCAEAQQKWKSISKSNKETSLTFRNKMILTFIWDSNKLEGTLPKEVNQGDLNEVLLKSIEGLVEPKLSLPTDLSWVDKPTQQLLNHLRALFLLCYENSEKLPTLSEELIKHTHRIMMQGLETDDGTIVNAGEYRTISVHAGEHVFPSHECVPTNMAKIVAKYESKASATHDPYQLASWLFFHVVSLHPFEDGNGRLSRLLWCYSLMRDGLPFPVVLTSGHKRSQKHLVWCLERDRRLSAVDQPNLTSLSLKSVGKAWDSFLVETKSLVSV